MMSDENKEGGNDKLEEFPLVSWKMSSIFDERKQGPEYWLAIDRHTGKAAEKEIESMQKQSKKYEERKIDRGFDIVNTWKIKETYL